VRAIVALLIAQPMINRRFSDLGNALALRFLFVLYRSKPGCYGSASVSGNNA
jgi:hypothetical protein